METLKLFALIFLPIFILLTSCKDEGNPIQTPITGTIQGKVTNSTGDSLIAGATVTTSPPTSSVTTNSSGEYTISDVSPGQYSVTAIKGGYNSGTVTISVAAGKTTTANIPLNLSSVVTGLVAYYPFNNNANDESGNGNNGNLNGVAFTSDRFQNENKACIISGNTGTNGSNIHVGIPDIIEGLTKFTISIWVKENNLSYYHGESYISFGADSAGATGWTSIGHLDRYGVSSLRFIIMQNNLFNEIYTPFDESWANNWQHYAMVFDGYSCMFKAFHNGNLIGSKSISITSVTTYQNFAAIAKHWFKNAGSTGSYLSSSRFNGIIDDIRIFNSALTDQEVQQLYQEGGWTSNAIGTLPLSNMNWICYSHAISNYINPSVSVFESVSEGLKIYGTGYRRGADEHPVPLNQYPIGNKTMYFKWKAYGGGDFMGVGPRIFTDSISWSMPYYPHNLTTHHSYLNSYVITDNLWYYTK